MHSCRALKQSWWKIKVPPLPTPKKQKTKNNSSDFTSIGSAKAPLPPPLLAPLPCYSCIPPQCRMPPSTATASASSVPNLASFIPTPLHHLYHSPSPSSPQLAPPRLPFPPPTCTPSISSSTFKQWGPPRVLRKGHVVVIVGLDPHEGNSPPIDSHSPQPHNFTSKICNWFISLWFHYCS